MQKKIDSRRRAGHVTSIKNKGVIIIIIYNNNNNNNNNNNTFIFNFIYPWRDGGYI
jgi:hypothetical protein